MLVYRLMDRLAETVEEFVDRLSTSVERFIDRIEGVANRFFDWGDMLADAADELVDHLRQSFPWFLFSRGGCYVLGAGIPVLIFAAYYDTHPTSAFIGAVILSIMVIGFARADWILTYEKDKLSFLQDWRLFRLSRRVQKKHLLDFNIKMFGGNFSGNGRFYWTVHFNEEADEWLRENMTGEYGMVPAKKYCIPKNIYFENERDATMYKMRFG